ncbi:hypothetical protein GGI17_000408 [Coemansia sp. S146]|nr:hypothetical protein GGI17_000408 [Coemansia sp. S146]
MGSRASSAEQLPTTVTPIAMNLRDKPGAPKDGEAQHASRYDTRSHNAPTPSPNRAADVEPVTPKGAPAPRATLSHTARHGRPRKAAPSSTGQPTVNVDNATRSDSESEDEAITSVAVTGEKESTHGKAKELVDHSSDSTHHSDKEPVVNRGRPHGRPRKVAPSSTARSRKTAPPTSKGRPRGRPPKKAKVDDSESEVEAVKSAAAQSSEDSSSGEGARPLRTAPARWKTSNVYVEILVDGQGGEGDKSDDVGLAITSADTPLNIATHASTDSVAYSAAAVVDSNPLIIASQVQHSDDEERDDDGGFLNEGSLANSQPLAGLGAAADLMVLDYLSQRVIDEVNTVVQALDDGKSGTANLSNASFKCLDGYAHEQVLIRKNHFTREPFLTCDHRPVDEDDSVQWASSLQRINMATFLLLVFRPLIAVAKPVSSNMPNRERMISSMGLKAAAQGVFANVVPVNLRSAETVDLLVDLLTQQILAAANDEKHLQTLVSDVRETDDAGIAKMLGIEDYGVSDDADRRDTSHFAVFSVPYYRKELARRLNRISGGKLHITRSQYSLHALWKKVLPFCSQCATNWRIPSILGDISGRQADTSFNVLDGADETDEQEDDATSDSERDVVLDFEGDAELDFERDAKHQTTDDPTAAEETESVTNDRVTNAAPIDPSFREERRIATLLRDVLTDAHLEELLESIEAEHIDISDPQVQSRTPRRVHPARRHVFAQVPSHGVDDGGYNNGDASDNGSEFRLDVEEEAEESMPDSADERAAFGRGKQASMHRRLGKRRVGSDNDSEFRLEEIEEEAEASVPGNADERAAFGRSKQANTHRRLGKRRVDSDHSSESDLDEEELRMARDIVRTIRVPAKRSHQSSDFRGRRGIAAEDMSDLVADSRDRIVFTPSASNSPVNTERRGNAGVNGRDKDSGAYESLGQYRPLKLVRSMPTRNANAGASGSRDNRDNHSDYSDQSDHSEVRRGTGGRGRGQREKPIQHRVRWTEAEEECLVRALTEFGPHWALILQHYGEGGSRSRALQHRTRRHLKDKARNIKRRLMREDMPLGPFVDVTG